MSTHRTLAVLVACIAALVAAMVAAFAPVEWFEFFRLQVVGSPEPLDSNLPQRVDHKNSALPALEA